MDVIDMVEYLKGMDRANICQSIDVRRNALGLVRSLRVPIVLVAIITWATAPVEAEEKTTYTYDALGRLVKIEAARTSGNYDAAYTIDKAGNRTRVTVVAPAQVINGNFEDPAVAGYAVGPSALNLRFGGQAGISSNGGPYGFPTPWSGSQVAFIQGSQNQGGFVELTATGLVSGTRYVFAFAAARRPGYPENAIKITIDGTLVWDGPPVTADHFTAHPTQSFLATSTRSIIRFSSTPTSYDSASAIDAVSVQPVNY